MTESIRLVVVDDHAFFRRGLVDWLNQQPDFLIVGEAGSGPEAVRLCLQQHPNVVLMDIHMPGGSGMKAVQALKQIRNQNIQVLMLTISDKDNDLLGALAAGADGYLLKNTEPDELCRAIRQVATGQGVLAPEVTTRVIQAAADQGQQLATNLLSQREQDVLLELAQGLTTAEIATMLAISENTVKTHVRRILKKLKASNRTEAVARAAALGIIPQS